MINISSSTTSTTVSMPSSPAVEEKLVASAANSSVSSATAEISESSQPIISPQGAMLSDLFAAADEFIRNEHLAPYQGIRYSYGSWGYIIDDEGSYLDIGKYNNYLFDKAATSLLKHAKEKGITLDKNEVIAQLKANNPEIAAMKLDNQNRRDILGQLNLFSKETLI
jgi:hypothetical protein